MRSSRPLLDQGCRDDQRQDNKFHHERQLVLVVKDSADGCCSEDNGNQSECHGGSEALFCHGIGNTQRSYRSTPFQRDQSISPETNLRRTVFQQQGSVSNQEHCAKDSLLVSHLLSYTKWVRGSAMKIDSANAQPMGSLIFEGGHKPFHALACPLKPASVRISRKA